MTKMRAAGSAMVIAMAIACAHPRGAARAEPASEAVPLGHVTGGGTALRGAPPPSGDRVWCERDDATLHGPVAEWFPGGGARLTGEYRDGAKHGAWSSSYASGKPRSEEHWRAGQPTGTWVTYFEGGQRSSETLHREDGALAFRSYRPDGSKLRQGTYVNGREHGTWIEWDAAGVATTSQWKDGVRTSVDAAAVIGIPECDAFLVGYARCIEERAPEAARKAMRDTLDATLTGWRAALADPVNHAAIAQGCKAMNDSALLATAAMGCKW